MIRSLPELCALILFSLVMALPSSDVAAKEVRGESEHALPCKYSVRDVGFVNVHGKGWQLLLLKPLANAPDPKFDENQEVVAKLLARTNISHTWYSDVSNEAVTLGRTFRKENDNRTLVGAAYSPGGQSFPIWAADSTALTDLDYNEVLSPLFESPTRNKILNAVSDSLCAIVLFESGNKEKDDLARKMLDESVKKLNRQIWTLEKPVDNGPIPIVVESKTWNADKWLQTSLGNFDAEQPAVGVFYGQGRLLGELQQGESLTVDRITGMAAITGRDCECDLDRDWLYGKQFPHRWTLALERKAESQLNFDPHSSIVKAEVTQIIRKVGERGRNETAPIGLGSGLVIHDLDALENPVDEPGKTTPKGEEKSSGKKPAPAKPEPSEQPEPNADSPTEQTDSSPSFPWAVVVAIAVALMASVIFVTMRGRG